MEPSCEKRLHFLLSLCSESFVLHLFICQKGNRLVNVTSGLLNLVDVTVESQSSFHIGGGAMVSWRGNADGGMNGFGGMKYPPPYFDITGACALVELTNKSVADYRLMFAQLMQRGG